MSWLRFFDDTIAHLAWPIFILFALWLFRKEIRGLFGEVTDARVTIGKTRLNFRFRNRVKSELEYVAADITHDENNSPNDLTRHTDNADHEQYEKTIKKVTTPDSAKGPSMDKSLDSEADDESKQWADIERYLAVSPHFAIHLAGLRIDAILANIAGPDAPALAMLARPKYLADQELISQELADAAFRLLRVRNTVDGSPKFMLTQDIATDFVTKAHELVAALNSLA